MKTILENIAKSFNHQIRIKEKRPGTYQLFLPFFHEDGDMIDLFIEPEGKNTYKLCDYGMTLMRLSYSYEIDTPNKHKILQKMINENHLHEIDGKVVYISNPDTLYTDILNICQAIMKIGSMRYFKREVIESLFYELLDEFIIKDLTEFNPQKNVQPIQLRDELEADYGFKANGRALYLFGVKDTAKARLAAINCLEYQKAKLNFRSIIVHDDFEKISRKDRSCLTNICDKQFTTLQDFENNAVEYFEREKNN